MENLQKWLKFNLMKFIEIINNKKFILINIFLFLYVTVNLFDGERGLFSYYEKQKIKLELLDQKEFLTTKLVKMEKKNNLLTNTIDLDYLETLYRKKFMFGKPSEKIYINN